MGYCVVWRREAEITMGDYTFIEPVFIPKKMKITVKQVELTTICVALGLLRDMYSKVPGYDLGYLNNLIKSLERRRKQTRRVA